MRTRITSRNVPPNHAESQLVGADPRASESRSTQSPKPRAGRAQHQGFVSRTPNSPTPRNEIAELLADIDGVPVLFRLLVADMPVDARSESVRDDASLHPLLSSTLEKMVDRMRGSPRRRDIPSQQPLATVELISSAEHLSRLPVLSNDTVLRVGPLELDLLDRTARRDGRQIDLRPREFQLLKYMMQRSEKLLTRATLLKEVWNYKFVPETNLVDVHMGRLRRKVDGSNEAPLIRNVRGVGFVLSATSFSQCLTSRPGKRSAAWPSDYSSQSVERVLQW